MNKIHAMYIIYMMLSILPAKTFANNDSCQKENIIFYSYNMNHTKVVELCKKRGVYKYSFGRVGKPEIKIINKSNNINLEGGMFGGFEVKNGDISYSVISGKLGTYLFVEKKNRELSKIQLDDNDQSYINRTLEN